MSVFYRQITLNVSKDDVSAWIQSITGEWSKYNIRVNAIASAIWTPMYDKTRPRLSLNQLAKHDESCGFTRRKLGNVEKFLSNYDLLVFSDL